jgi:hypothetical protein
MNRQKIVLVLAMSFLVLILGVIGVTSASERQKSTNSSGMLDVEPVKIAAYNPVVFEIHVDTNSLNLRYTVVTEAEPSSFPVWGGISRLGYPGSQQDQSCSEDRFPLEAGRLTTSSALPFMLTAWESMTDIHAETPLSANGRGTEQQKEWIMGKKEVKDLYAKGPQVCAY